MTSPQAPMKEIVQHAKDLRLLLADFETACSSDPTLLTRAQRDISEFNRVMKRVDSLSARLSGWKIRH
jgi:hypothetical protein